MLGWIARFPPLLKVLLACFLLSLAQVPLFWALRLAVGPEGPWGPKGPPLLGTIFLAGIVVCVWFGWWARARWRVRSVLVALTCYAATFAFSGGLLHWTDWVYWVTAGLFVRRGSGVVPHFGFDWAFFFLGAYGREGYERPPREMVQRATRIGAQLGSLVAKSRHKWRKMRARGGG